MRRLMPGFVDAFHLIHLEEMTEFQVQNVLTKYALFAQNTLKINIEKAALDLSIGFCLVFILMKVFQARR